MNFEKTLLIITGSVLSVLLTSSLQAAEKTQTIDAIWESMGALASGENNKAKKAQPPTFTREQYQARYKLEQALKQKRAKLVAQKVTPQKSASRNVTPQKSMTKLDRQRVAWKVKWDAQQAIKKRAQAKPQQATAPKAVPVVAKQLKPVWKPPVAQQKVLPKAQQTAQQKILHKAPQKLTRAQYQWRWKQAQLKKQQQYTQAQPKTAQLAAKASHATFRKSNQKAIYQNLPMEIVAKLRATKTSSQGVSAFAQDVNSPRPLLAYQENTARVPASVMKIITGYAALGTLGQHYRWPLDVFTKGSVQNGTLQGDLIIKGYGSPEFKSADLRKVLHGIRQKGIRNVNGRIVFDNSYFNIPNLNAFDGKKQSKYNAQPDALLFNERINTFQVRTVGKRVKISTTTPTHNLRIVNRMRKSNRGCRPRIGVSKRAGQTIVTFSGRFSRRCGTRSYSRVISRPAEMIYGSMQAMWRRDVGGKLNTRFAMGRTPANAKPLLRTYSRTLAEILPSIIKDSNNVMARQLLLTIGAKHTGHGTPRSGANAIGQWLASRGLHFPELRIENGSGLSRTARISAAHVGDLLVDAYRSPFRHVFMRSLAVAGVDGTMKGRLRGTQVRGRGFFKTGTLRDVRSIAGYVKAANGKTYVMAILQNDPRARKRSLRAHDKLIEWVYAGGRSNQQLARR